MRNLIRTEWRLLLFGFLMTFWSAPGQTFFISLFSAQLRDELSLSHGQFGSLYSIGTLASAILVVWSGALLDRVDLRRFSLAILIGLALGCIAMALSSNLFVLVVAIFMLRHFGQGLMFMTASTSVVRYLDASKGKATALSSMGYSLSEALMPSLIVLCIAMLSWRGTWLLAAAIVLFLVIPLVIWLLRDHPERHEKYLQALEQGDPGQAEFRRRQWQRREVLRDPRFYLCVPNLMATTLLFTGFIFHQVHLVSSKGWQLQVWTTYFAVYASVAIAMKFVAGYLADRFTATALLPLHSVPLLAAMLLLSSSSEPWVALVFLMLMAMTSGLQNTIVTPFLSEQYGNKHLGGIKSMMSSVMVLVSALSPAAMGWMIDRGISLEQQALMGATFTFIAIVLAFIGVGYLGRGGRG